MLDANGVEVITRRFPEPSLAPYGRVGWIGRAFSALVATRWRMGRDDVVILAWPLLGFIDTMLVGVLFGRRGHVVLHDPVPLVRASGYGPIVRRLATRWCRARLIVHSERARADLAELGFDRRPLLLPHPVLASLDSTTSASGHQVIVLGQFKPDRDVRAMEAIAASGAAAGDLHVYGRGWPDVAGWNVHSRFLDEAEFTQRIAEADVVLIPYRRFYQSGVAVRAVELGTPVVGPRGTSLDELLAGRPELLVDPEDISDWIRALEAAVALTESDCKELLADYVERLTEPGVAPSNCRRRPRPDASATVEDRSFCRSIPALPANPGRGQRHCPVKWARPLPTRSSMQDSTSCWMASADTS